MKEDVWIGRPYEVKEQGLAVLLCSSGRTIVFMSSNLKTDHLRVFQPIEILNLYCLEISKLSRKGGDGETDLNCSAAIE
jgi:hypothetical protein